MAKIGEGDPRWIVTDRGDGKNVNSWHWEEKDLTNAAHEALKQRFKDFAFPTNSADLVITAKEISDISGDCTVAQRKGKIMCYFGIKLTIKWKATVAGASKAAEGKLAIEEVEHENYKDDYDVAVSTTENDAASEKAAQWLRGTGRKVVRSTIQQYFDEVFAQHKVGSNVSGSPPPQGSPAKMASAAPAAAAPKPAAPSAPSGGASSLQWKMQWRVPAEELFLVLTDEQRASVYTRAPAKIDPRAGGTFEFLGGVISGYYVDVQRPNKLTMQWRLSSWPSGIFSSVVIVLTKEEAAVTILEFAQAGIPSGEYERVKQGWQVNFFDPIKMIFGFSMEYM
jgi:activator of HSP90 ATPase